MISLVSLLLPILIPIILSWKFSELFVLTIFLSKLSNPLLLKPRELTRAWCLGKRKILGLGFPF